MVPGTGRRLEAMRKQLGERAIIAEDLGFLTPSVAKMLADTGYPGMKVLEFAFDRRDQAGGRVYQPHNYPANCVACVGTHDNDPAGWFENAEPRDIAFARDYLKLAQDEDQVWGMMRAIWASTANLAVVQAQDLLGLGSKARMNTPSTLGGNWCWRALPGYVTPQLATRMAHEMHLYERLPGRPRKRMAKRSNRAPRPPKPSNDNPRRPCFPLGSWGIGIGAALVQRRGKA